MDYPALLPTTKTYDKLASSMVNRELRSRIRQFQQHCFHTTLNFLLTQWVQLFPVLWYMIWYICQVQVGWHLVAVVHRKNTENTNNNRTTRITTNWEECGPCPVFASYTLAFALQLRKKHGEISARVADECQLAHECFFLKHTMTEKSY